MELALVLVVGREDLCGRVFGESHTTAPSFDWMALKGCFTLSEGLQWLEWDPMQLYSITQSHRVGGAGPGASSRP